MTVRPHNLHRIIADQLHISNQDVLRYGGRVDNALAGHLVDTPGTMASEAEVSVRIVADMVWFPRYVQLA